MKALISTINSSYTHTSYSMYVLLSMVDFSRFEAYGYETTINQMDEKILNDLVEKDCDIYFFSTYIWNIQKTLKVASLLKKVKNCTIILGGTEAAYRCDDYIKNEYIDAIAIGEGEILINEILECLDKGIELSTIDNIVTRETNEKTIITPPFDFSTRPFPYTDNDLLDIKDKIVYYETSRGCPNSCSFCMSSVDRHIRAISVDKVKEEITKMVASGIKLIKFLDRTFNYNDKRACQIVRFINESDFDARFHFEVCLDWMSEELMSLLEESKPGTFQLEIGLQSIDEKVLKAANRRCDLNKFSRNFTRLKSSAKMHLHADLIAMMPYETMDTFAKAYDYLYELGPHMLQLGFLKVLPGTEFYLRREEYGLIYDDQPPYEVLRTKTISYEEKVILKKIDTLTDKISNTGSFTRTMAHLMKKFDSAFELMLSIASYASDTGFFTMDRSKNDYYKLLYEYASCDDTVGYLLSYDYVTTFKRRVPNFLAKYCYEFKGDERFHYILDGNVGNNIPDSYKGQNEVFLNRNSEVYELKELNKKESTFVIVYNLRPDPIDPSYCFFVTKTEHFS